MAPPLSTLYTLSFAIAVLATLFVAATLRLLAILPPQNPTRLQCRKRSSAARLLIVLGSGGHTHEMFYLLRDLDTSKYTHRTYVVSSGDAFSAKRAVQFEKELEGKEDMRVNQDEKMTGGVQITVNDQKPPSGPKYCVGAEHYDIAVVSRARKIHQPLLTTPFSALYCLWSCFMPLLGVPQSRSGAVVPSSSWRDVADTPDLIITNGPATAVIVILASFILRFFNIKGANTRGKCKTIYAESFARVKNLSLSGKILSRIVDRFLVQWEELEGAGGGRGEYWGILV